MVVRLGSLALGFASLVVFLATWNFEVAALGLLVASCQYEDEDCEDED